MSEIDSHPELAGLVPGLTLRIHCDESEPVVATVDDVRRHAERGIATHAVTCIEDGYNGSVWDLEAEYDPRNGWLPPRATKRQYLADTTRFVSHGPATVEAIDPGIDPDQLQPGVTVEAVDTDRYRVVVAPWEREYDNRALAYNLDSGANVCEKLDPEEVVARVE